MEHLKLAIAVIAHLVGYFYPFVAVWRGKPLKSAVLTSWGILAALFTGVCLVTPSLGSLYSRELGDRLVMSLPDAPILIPIFFFGWIPAWIAGSIAAAVQSARRR